MSLSRRSLILSGAALAAGCTGAPRTGRQIDAEVAASRQQLFASVAGTQSLYERSAGVLIIPNIIEGGFVLSGAYGEGALLVGDATVDYLSVTAAAFGFQIGGQSYAQAVFFTTPEALANFRQTDGWEVGVDAEVAVLEDGAAIGTSTALLSQPIYQIIYGQRGLIVGASLEGAKYSRIIR
ncbi:MAG: lipid-binding SYLF domain-containing protein [Pseudomonadota bacterium]